jgi:DNA-binding winged helix-turn-helix (wHTH) protein
VPVEPQVLDLLLFLIRTRDRIASKEDLIANVWNGRSVSDSTLSSRITIARQAIGDSGDEQRLIRTFPRKGVRFVGDVREELPVPTALQPRDAPLSRITSQTA